MDEHKNVEDWADALLDQHRTDSSSMQDQPFVVRLLTRLNGEAPDPLMLERFRRNRERSAGLVKAEAVVTMIGTVVLCVLAYAVYSPF